MAKIKIKETCREHLISRIREGIDLCLDYSQFNGRYGMVFSTIHNLRVEWFIPIQLEAFEFIQKNIKSNPEMTILAIRYAD